ncbi:MAG: DNA-3-methyladenine glycosylase I [Neomegalonema sp.]|nr:DNA-3-methyladenine glycosylase I [Neomegalonema sp.]
MDKPDIILGEDGQARCWWCGQDPLYQRYHDEEWGWPVTDDRRLFEKICLEGFQSGLSWLTILRKREGFRAAFANFEIDEVAEFGEADVARLLEDAGIVRHRQKIESTINNARAARQLRDEMGSLSAYFWKWEHAPDERPSPLCRQNIVGQTPTSTALSKDLKKRGWRFVGPTTAYAFCQAMGLVNDHMPGCHAHASVEAAPRPAS